MKQKDDTRRPPAEFAGDEKLKGKQDEKRVKELGSPGVPTYDYVAPTKSKKHPAAR